MKLWLDDRRPCPDGWTLARTAREAIELLKRHHFEAASLDHDLGHCESCTECSGYKSACGCECHWSGMTVVIFMITTGLWPETKPGVHSANPVGSSNIVASIERYWPDRQAGPKLLTYPPGEVPGAKWIELTKGEWAIVDEEDYAKAQAHGWYFFQPRKNLAGYARAKINKKQILLHRFLLDLGPNDPQLDHVNGDTLDCRRCNLRPATGSQNVANQGLRSNNTSGYKGVSWSNELGKWRAGIRVRGEWINLGSFELAEDAHQAYSAAARTHFGPFANTGAST